MLLLVCQGEGRALPQRRSNIRWKRGFPASGLNVGSSLT